MGCEQLGPPGNGKLSCLQLTRIRLATPAPCIHRRYSVLWYQGGRDLCGPKTLSLVPKVLPDADAQVGLWSAPEHAPRLCPQDLGWMLGSISHPTLLGL